MFTANGSRFTVIPKCLLGAIRTYTLFSLVLCLLSVGGCTKNIDIDIPAEAEQVVVEGTIEINTPPIVLLTKSSKFFDNINVNDIGSYFIHGAALKVTASDGQQTELVEFCLQSLNLPPDQQELLLNALGFTSVDSAQIPNVCVYTVPDVINYFVSGNCSFMGKERTSYALDIVSPPLYGSDSVHLTSSTYIPTAIGIDSLSFGDHVNPAYRDSMMAVEAHLTVPDTFGNFVRYLTKRNSEPFYKPRSSSVYDDRLFVGLSIALPLERGAPADEKFDLNTAAYFWRGDTVTVKWSNIDSKTYDFFYTLENDGGDSPFSSPVRIKTNINNGLGIWAGYATNYYTTIVPQ